jgi:lipid II:glycine glycyltransferase (peptidoglycan interpeptide bridge formation enzyme)
MIKELLTYEDYVTALINFDDYHFSQSAVFLAVRQYTKTAVRYFAYEVNGQVKALTQVLVKPVLKNKKMLLLPFGPLVKADLKSEELNQFLKAIAAKYENVVFLQTDLFSMNAVDNAVLQTLLAETKLPCSFNAFRHSDGTTVIDLTTSPQEQFPNYRKDVKYNIKKVEKDKQLEIVVNRNPDRFADFWRLYEATQHRKHFNDQRYDLYKSFYDQDSAFLIEAHANGEMVAAVFCLEYKEQNTLITFLSSTTPSGNRLKAPTYLRWKILNYAYENKFKQLDLFSVDKELEGHSAFKLGFRGEMLWFNQPRDLVVQPLFYKILKILKRFK